MSRSKNTFMSFPFSNHKSFLLSCFADLYNPTRMIKTETFLHKNPAQNTLENWPLKCTLKTLWLLPSLNYYYLYQDKHTPGSQMQFRVRFIGQQNILKKRSVNGVKIGVKTASKAYQNCTKNWNNSVLKRYMFSRLFEQFFACRKWRLLFLFPIIAQVHSGMEEG